ncbi:MAG: glycosyltransferase family 39 protein [Anaerolineae bacterium]|nr:glycosyltransferase family 39 protein [Candidatus Roseilinea sp.]MDW8450946.1 glycosyltransferase family 39 protein [Anaerolineae bacterium]
MNEVSSLQRTAYWPLIAILLIYTAAGVIYALTAPFLEVSDEVRHYAMVEHLAQGRGLPVQDEVLNRQITEEERRALRPLTHYAQEGSQPPLYYALMALVALPFDRSDHADLVWPNPHARLGRADATNNWNQLIHTPAEAFPWRKTMLVVMLMRFIGVALGAATVACTYALVLELRGQGAGGKGQGSGVRGRKAGVGSRELEQETGPSQFLILNSQFAAMLAAALIAFNPMFVHIMASVNNDTLATTLATLALLLAARMIRRGASVRGAIVLGVVLGGAALTKASGLALAIVAPCFVLASALVRRMQADAVAGQQSGLARSLARLFPLLLGMALPALAIAGWWYLRNQMLYGDFTGTAMMARIAGPREVAPTVLELIGEWDGFFKSYWGLFGAVNIPMDLWIYAMLQLLLILAGFGLLLALIQWPREVRHANSPFSILNSQFSILLMLLSAFLVAFVALLRWTSLTLASQGRLLFPVIAPISIFLALGLLCLAASASRITCLRNTQYATAIAIPVTLAALTLLAPFVYIRPAYALPQRLAEADLPALDRQTELFFEDKIRYLGFRVHNPKQRVAPGDLLDVTLYWQALRPLERNYSAFVRVYAKGDQPVHVLDTYPGGGMWQTTLWQPGEIIADRYRLRIDDTLTNTQLAPSTLWLDVGFWDFTAQRFLPTFDPSGQPTGRQRYEAASLNLARPAPNFRMKARFERVALTAVRAEQAGREVILSVDWLVTDDFTEDYTTFVQLFDAAGNKMPPQADGRAKGGDFAPRWWRAGDLILDDAYTVVLPADFPPGAYTIKFGLYNAAGARMPAYDEDGRPIPDAALGVPVEIK